MVVAAESPSTTASDEHVETTATTFTLSESSEVNDEQENSGFDEDGEEYEYSHSSSLLSRTNKLLEEVGILSKPLLSFGELYRVSSSLFVAVYEYLFHTRIDAVNRHPKSAVDYIRNAQLVVDHLKEKIQMDLKHITGEAIVEGDKNALSNLVNIFMRIIAYSQEESLSSIETSDSLKEEGISNGDKRHKARSDSITSSLESTSVDGRDKTDDRKGAERLHRLSSLAIKKAEKLHNMDRKMEMARKRRDRLWLVRQAKYRDMNYRKAEKSRKVLKSRWVEDRKRDSKAFMLRKKNLDQRLLQEVYQNCINKMQSWKMEEHKEIILNLRDDEKCAKDMVDSIRSSFDYQIDTLKEQEMTLKHQKVSMNQENIVAKSQLIRMLKERNNEVLNKVEDNLNHSREKELLRRRQIYEKLFEDFLREGRLEPKSKDDAKKRNAVTSQRTGLVKKRSSSPSLLRSSEPTRSMLYSSSSKRSQSVPRHSRC